MFRFYNNRILGKDLVPLRFGTPKVSANVRSGAVVLLLLIYCLLSLPLFIRVICVVV